MPDCGEEFAYELTAKCLLLPGAGGVPTLQSDQVGEKLMIKIPEQFREIFSGVAGKPIDEELGQTLAEWAAGVKTDTSPFNVDLLANAYAECATIDRLAALEETRGNAWGRIDKAGKARLKTVSDAAKARLTPPSQTTETIPESAPVGDPEGPM
jgi:hypothetical protein